MLPFTVIDYGYLCGSEKIPDEALCMVRRSVSLPEAEPVRQAVDVLHGIFYIHKCLLRDFLGGGIFGPGGIEAVVLNGIADPVFAAACSMSVFSAVFFQKISHFPAYPSEPLPVSLRGDAQNLPRNTAVRFEHGAQDKDTAAFRVKALQHDIGTGHFQFLSQHGFFHVLGQVGDIPGAAVFNIIAVELKA